MEYHIFNEGGVKIASFEYEFDRNDCLEMFQREYPDSMFEAVDE